MNWALLIPSAGLIAVALAFVALASLTRGHHAVWRVVLLIVLGVVGIGFFLAVTLQDT